GDGCEDVVRVGRVEVDGAVDLEDVAAAGRVGRDVYAREIEPECGDRAEGELTCRRRRIDASADGAQRHVRPPFARQGVALDRTDDPACNDDDAEVVARRFDERLDECTLATKPAPPAEAFEPRPELALVVTAVDVAAPAAKTRLHDVRGRKARQRHLAEVRRPRLLDPESAEQESGRELVVGRKQSEWAVHDLRTLTLQAGQLPKPRLDPVERRQDVEPR